MQMNIRWKFNSWTTCDPCVAVRLMRLWLLSIVWVISYQPVFAEPNIGEFPYPDDLRADILFWERVYGRIDSQSGLLHDDHRLNIVYEVINFSSPDHTERVAQVEHEREQIEDSLRALASHPTEPATDNERRMAELWGHPDSQTLLDAAEHVRFQLGQADKTREGLQRAMTFKSAIQRTLSEQGVPPELWVLPLVESSFNVHAYSKVGAAGVWQLMPSVVGHQLRIDSLIDERFDPVRASLVAAQLLANNRRVLGNWPLAITAYNHGLNGTLHGRQDVGTDNITVLLRQYHGTGFGFASRNFYPAFCAVLDIASHPSDYYLNLPTKVAMDLSAQALVKPALASQLAAQWHISVDSLRELNPALSKAIWSDKQAIPSGVSVWLPKTALVVTSSDSPAGNATVVSSASLSPSGASVVAGNARAKTVATVSGNKSHLVVAGDSLMGIAQQEHIPIATLLALNHLKIKDTILPGQRLIVAQSPHHSAQHAAHH